MINILNQKEMDECLNLMSKNVRISFNGSKIKGVTFKKEISKKISFANSELEDCTFIGIDLINIDFSNAKMKKVRIINCQNIKFAFVNSLEINNSRHNCQDSKEPKPTKTYKPRAPIRSDEDNYGIQAVKKAARNSGQIIK
jgi:uncharacterized protein YjbI with pentapeptide repeats